MNVWLDEQVEYNVQNFQKPLIKREVLQEMIVKSKNPLENNKFIEEYKRTVRKKIQLARVLVASEMGLL